MNDMNEILGKAFKIGQNANFKVKIYHMNDNNTKDYKELTYLELGSFLITNAPNIKNIDIIMINYD